METIVIIIQKMAFEIIYPEGEEESPFFEIENNTSAVLLEEDGTQALALRDLLMRFIEVSHA